MLEPACSWLLLLHLNLMRKRRRCLDGEMVLECMRLYRGQGAGRQVVTLWPAGWAIQVWEGQVLAGVHETSS